MIKVLITNPPWIFETSNRRKRLGIRAGSRWPLTTADNYKPTTYTPYPGFMGYATSYLLSQGVEAKFYDAIACRHDYDQFYRNVDRFTPHIIIQETSTPSFPIDMEIAKRLHEKYEVCLVGPHVSALADDVIQLPYVDYILKGEYEYSSLEMINNRKKGIYHCNGKTNIDDLPYPYRDEEIIHHYRESVCKKSLTFPQLWVYGSRGCAFKCDFCLWVHTMFENRLTLRKPLHIVDEVDNMVSKYGFRYILFDDDCWNLGGKERIMEIADGLYKIGTPWCIIGRLDTCDRDIFKYMVDRGCVGFRLGVESFSQPLLNRIDKRLKIKETIEMINYLKTLDVSLFLLFMHYLPGERWWERLKQKILIKKICRGKNIAYQNPPCIPFPGTPYYNDFLRNRINLTNEIDWDEYDGANIGGNLKEMVRKYSTG